MATTSEYDFVVIGAGSAGSTLAARLSEDATVSVLFLVAGDRDPHEFVADPPVWPRLQGTRMDWADQTVPQEHVDGMVVPWPRGKGLGGSSLINATVFPRGHRSSYDWGLPGWTDAVHRALKHQRHRLRHSRTRGRPDEIRRPK